MPDQTTNGSEAFGITDAGLAYGQVPVQVGASLVYRSVIWDAAGNATPLQDLMADGNTWSFGPAIAIDADATAIRVVDR